MKSAWKEAPKVSLFYPSCVHTRKSPTNILFMLCQHTNKYFQKISIFSSSKNPQYSIPLVSTHPRAPLLGFRPVAPCHSQSAPQNLSQFFIWFFFHIYFTFWFFRVHTLRLTGFTSKSFPSFYLIHFDDHFHFLPLTGCTSKLN